MLTLEQVDLYRRNGFLTGLTIVRPEEAGRYRAQFDALEQRVGRERARIGLVDCHFDEPFIRELAAHPRILDGVEALLGPDVLLLATHFFCKYGPEEWFVAWHQDVTYWGLEPPVAVTAWYAVDDSDWENGCMRVIPGTHHNGFSRYVPVD
ncbi:MAG TPA: phytanoyl-CoA dioxygenase family protein, partial [Chthonomonadaceae bacterium]|nr:phytanoyl-CoA dioxygenase family protein [Chthonomonadaceae bacterium]